MDSQKDVEKKATVVNLHGDYSSEKVVIGHYLDGKATLVVGDHWHVPTADARFYQTARRTSPTLVCAARWMLSLGITFDSVIPRWRDGKQTRNVLETKGPKQFNAVLVATNKNGLAGSIEQIQQVF